MTEVIGEKTILIPEHLSQALLSGPSVLQRRYMSFSISWVVLTAILIPLGVADGTGAILLVTAPLLLAPPVFRRITMDRPARELSRKIQSETECGERWEQVIFYMLRQAPWDTHIITVLDLMGRKPRLSVVVHTSDDETGISRRIDFSEDLSSLTLGPTQRKTTL